MKKIGLLFFVVLALSLGSLAQETVTGAQVHTHDNYLYGRFEVRMQSAPGNGIISSYFLYNFDVGCNWPAQNNEIDIEMLGNHDDQVQFTTHYPGAWFFAEDIPVDFNPHAEMHEYAMEWEPGIVRWFIDGELSNIQDQSFVDDLIYPQRLMMNLWVANAAEWVGPWDPSILPRSSHYDWVKVYNYTPGTGDTGTNNNFTLDFEDDFDGDSLNPEYWEITDFGGFEGNIAGFYAQNVTVSDGQLNLHLTEPGDWITTIPVAFSVDMSLVDLEPTDVININGSFNNWCGNCSPMSDPDGDNIWTTTLQLQPGEYEYLFTKNFWEGNGGAPVGSECDWQPCDEFANYGLIVAVDDEGLVEPTYCWGTCGVCGEVNVAELERLSAEIALNGSTVQFQAQAGDQLEVYDAGARLVYSTKLETATGTLELPENIQGWVAVRLVGEGRHAVASGLIAR